MASGRHAIANRLGLDRDLLGDARRRGSNILVLLLLHSTQDHGGRHVGEELRRVGEGEEFLVVPLASRDIPALAVGEHGRVLGPEEVGDRVAVLSWVEGHDPVDARLHLVPAREAQRVADVDNGATVLGLHEPELAGAWRADLEAPLLTEEQGQRADVGVLLVPDLLGDRVGRNVVHHGERGGGWAVVAVSVLEPGTTCEPEPRRQRREDGLRDDVAACDRILQDLDVRAVLDVAGQVGAGLLDFISSNLLMID